MCCPQYRSVIREMSSADADSTAFDVLRQLPGAITGGAANCMSMCSVFWRALPIRPLPFPHPPDAEAELTLPFNTQQKVRSEELSKRQFGRGDRR